MELGLTWRLDRASVNALSFFGIILTDILFLQESMTDTSIVIELNAM